MKWKPLAIAAAAAIIALALYQFPHTDNIGAPGNGSKSNNSNSSGTQSSVHTISAEGKLEARPGAEMQVGSAMTARIERFLVYEGDHIDKGQVIAVLDSKELVARLQQAEAEVAVTKAKRVEVAAGARDEEIKQAQAVLQRVHSEQIQAENEFNRTGRLFKDKFVSQATLDTSASAYKVATARVAEAEEHLRLLLSGPRHETLALHEAQVSQAEANVRHMRSLLDQTRVTSPISGVLIERYLDAGEVVMPEKPLVVIADTNRLRINAEVDETDAGRLKLGDPAEISAYAYPGKVYKGRIEEIAHYVGKREIKPNNPAVNLGLKIIQVKIALLEATPLKLGMTVDVRITPTEK
ncbi:MAG: efflux RND transporter periplasmic adaptor subunit [Nitrosomonadales bacterium]|nr:efflux RND transporter periplasmic adaptor subunit [Nitrosomonadales bacterium]